MTRGPCQETGEGPPRGPGLGTGLALPGEGGATVAVPGGQGAEEGGSPGQDPGPGPAQAHRTDTDFTLEVSPHIFKVRSIEMLPLDLDQECRKSDLEHVFMKYGPLKEIWLASYAPFYAFVVYRNRLDAQVILKRL